jgi:hypothetical protein
MVVCVTVAVREVIITSVILNISSFRGSNRIVHYRGLNSACVLFCSVVNLKLLVKG